MGKKWRLDGGDPKAYKANGRGRGGGGGRGGGEALAASAPDCNLVCKKRS